MSEQSDDSVPALTTTGGSFWDDYGIPPSAVEDILAKGSFTLEDLLKEDEVIQECKHLNEKLVAFLADKNTIKKLIEYVTMSPPQDKDEYSKKLKFPYTVSEIFACEVDIMLDVLIENEMLLDQLFSFLDKPAPLDPGNAAYFCKVVSVLIENRGPKLLSFIRKYGTIKKMLNHFELFSIMELLVQIWLIAPSDSDKDWIVKDNVLEMLTKKISSDDEKENNIVKKHATLSLFYAIEKSDREGSSELIAQMQKKDVVECLVHALNKNDKQSECEIVSVLVGLSKLKIPPTAEEKAAAAALKEAEAALNLAVSALKSDSLEDLQNLQENEKAPNFEHGNLKELHPDLKKDTDDEKDKKNVDDNVEGDEELDEKEDEMDELFTVLYENLVEIVKVLENVKELSPIDFSVGTLKVPLGPLRLKVVELLVCLMRLNHKKMNEKLVELKVIQLLLDLFFQYPYNTLLHRKIDLMVYTILRSHSVKMKETLFFDGKLVDKILDAENKYQQSKENHKIHLGYISFIYQMARNILKRTEAKDDVCLKAINDNKDWVTFVSGSLASSQKNQAIQLGGRLPENDALLNPIGDLTAILNQFSQGFDNNLLALLQGGMQGNYNFEEDSDDDDAQNPFGDDQEEQGQGDDFEVDFDDDDDNGFDFENAQADAETGDGKPSESF